MDARVARALGRDRSVKLGSAGRREEDVVSEMLEVKAVVMAEIERAQRYAGTRELVEFLNKAKKDYERQLWLPRFRDTLD